MEKVKIALVGAGAFGVKHLEGLARIPEAEVTYVVSSTKEKAQSVADKFGVPNASGDFDEVLASDEVDTVILCTPTHIHAAQTQA